MQPLIYDIIGMKMRNYIFISFSTKKIIREKTLATTDMNFFRLSSINTLNNVGFHKAIEECIITDDTIIVVESMHDQIVGAVLSATK